MYTKVVLTALVFAVTTFGAPEKTVDTNYTATYEDTTHGAIVSSPFPYYNGLFYKNIKQGPYNFQSGLCSYVCPQSFPALVVSGEGYTPKPGSISTIYKNSNVTRIKLNHLFWGCAATINRPNPNDPSTTYPSYEPANCTLTVLGYRTPQGHQLPASAGIKPDVRATFRYRPHITPNAHTYAASAPMSKAVFSGEWQGLKVVTFEVANRVPPYNEEAAFFMDNLNYVATNRTA